MTHRRDLLVLLASSALVPRLVRAQAPARVRRIGLLSTFSASAAAPWLQALREGLRDLGWVEGKNIVIEYRYAEGKFDRLPDLAADLVRLKVDVIVASDAPAAQKVSSAMPIVMIGADPVDLGLAESLARPRGNITGLSSMTAQMAGKRLELLKEMVPKLARVAVLWNPQNPVSTLTWQETELSARQLAIQLQSLEVRSPDDFDKAFEAATRGRVGALFVTADGMIGTNLKRIADAAAKHRLPSMFHRAEFPDVGGLASYGIDRADSFRRAATYVDKILKGAKPGDLPIDQAARFELVVNMKTARAIGLAISKDFLLRADRVIE